jgi:hypothetical protein
VFNAGKEIEAMKLLMLHRIASSLLLPSFASYSLSQNNLGNVSLHQYCLY